MRRQLRQHIVEGEAGGGGVAEQARHERAQAPVVLEGWSYLCGRGGDEGPDAASGLEDIGTLELGIYARDGIRVDLQLDGELPDGGQLIAGAKSAGGDRRSQRALELRVDRRRVTRIDRDDRH